MRILIFGTEDLSYFFAAAFFAVLGVVLSLLFSSTKRDIRAQSTPFHFSWSFLLLDNWKRIVTSVLLIFISLRFTSELTGKELTMFWAFVLGLGLDRVSAIIKNTTTLLDVNRDKIN